MFRALSGLKVVRYILLGNMFKFKIHNDIENIDEIISINLSILLKSLIFISIFFLGDFIELYTNVLKINKVEYINVEILSVDIKKL